MGKTASIQALSQIARVHLERKQEPDGRVPLWELFAPGSVLELSGAGPGKLSTAARLIAHAQSQAEPVVWISALDCASFYPPDLMAIGIDLDALVVVRLASEHGIELLRAAEMVLRSGAFGLVLLDFSQGIPKGALAWQSRLSGLVRMHDARLVLLTRSSAHEPSIGPLITLRTEARLDIQPDHERVVLSQCVIKSKLGGAVRPSPDVRALPAGACRRVHDFTPTKLVS